MSTRLRKVERFNTDVVDGEEGFNAVLQWKPNAIVLDLSFTRNGWLVHLGCFSSHICSHRKGDETRPRNLLGNAIKFTPEHGRIEVSLENDDSEIRLRIHDSGKGIDQELPAYLRTLRSRRQHIDAPIWRPRSRSHYRSSSCKAPRRNHPSRKPGEEKGAIFRASRSATCGRSRLKNTRPGL